jgi:hypothetical protein
MSEKRRDIEYVKYVNANSFLGGSSLDPLLGSKLKIKQKLG